jgi:iron complex outermembrane recepter protein
MLLSIKPHTNCGTKNFITNYLITLVIASTPTLTISSLAQSDVNTPAQPNTYQTLAFHENPLETITVTGTRDASLLRDTSASVGIINTKTIEDINATHSADVMNRVPGVFINQLGSTGQGTSAAIRQPITTNPVYLYLENGVPTRSPAFFNHNALYEVNVAQANGIEITKGPGSALYGSDAIGGIVNVISNAPIKDNPTQVTLEGGEFAWKRAQINSSYAGEKNKLAARVDAIDSEGWRENNDFDRQSANLIWQTDVAGFDINTVYSYTAIDMNTGGTGLSAADYFATPHRAGNRIGYREVSAQRLSSLWTKTTDAGEWSITPYFRSNRLEYLATWTLNSGRVVNGRLDSQDAHINKNGDDSYGVQFKFKRDIAGLPNAFWISGIDVDYGKGFTEQNYIIRTDSEPGRYWLEYRIQELIYDYDVKFTSFSPYVHLESDITDELRFNLGLRYDSIRYGYDNHLSTVTNSNTRNRPEDTTVEISHLSPKLGLTYDFSDTLNAFLSYRHGFRIPSESQLFRAGGTRDSTNLDAVKADSIELGVRGQMFSRINFQLSIYDMPKKDDIVSTVDQTTGARTNANAGVTDHRGAELGLDVELFEELNLGIAYARNEHKFDKWIENNQDASGNHMPNAPRSFTNLFLNYSPSWLNGGRLEAEWSRQGLQFVNSANTITYKGYDLLNLRASYQFNDSLQLYVNLLNAEDQLYAESVSSFGTNVSYTPGKPRTVYAGIKIHF